MINILNYINTEDQEIRFYYNEELERLIAWNLDTKELKELQELSHYEPIQQMLDIVCNDLKDLNFISELALNVIDDEIESIIYDKANLLLSQIKEIENKL